MSKKGGGAIRKLSLIMTANNVHEFLPPFTILALLVMFMLVITRVVMTVGGRPPEAEIFTKIMDEAPS